MHVSREESFWIEQPSIVSGTDPAVREMSDDAEIASTLRFGSLLVRGAIGPIVRGVDRQMHHTPKWLATGISIRLSAY